MFIGKLHKIIAAFFIFSTFSQITLVSTLSIYIIKTRYTGIFLSFFYLVNFLIFVAKVILESQRVTNLVSFLNPSTGMTRRELT